MNFNPISKIKELLEKRNIKDESELDEDERRTLNELKDEGKRLEEEITVETIRNFCVAEKKKIEAQWNENPDNTPNKDIYLKALHKIYSSIILIVDSPEVERGNYIKKLEDLINK